MSTTTTVAQTAAPLVASHASQLVQLGLTAITVLAAAGGVIWVGIKFFTSGGATSAQKLVTYVVANEFTKPINDLKEDVGTLKTDLANLRNDLDDLDRTAARSSDVNQRLNSMENSVHELRADVRLMIQKMQDGEQRRQEQQQMMHEQEAQERRYFEQLMNQHNQNTQRQIDFMGQLVNNIIQTNTETLKLYRSQQNQV